MSDGNESTSNTNDINIVIETDEIKDTAKSIEKEIRELNYNYDESLERMTLAAFRNVKQMLKDEHQQYNAKEDDPILYSIAMDYLHQDRAAVAMVAEASLGRIQIGTYEEIKQTYSRMDIITHAAQQIVTEGQKVIDDIKRERAESRREITQREMIFKAGWTVAFFLFGFSIQAILNALA